MKSIALRLSLLLAVVGIGYSVAAPADIKKVEPTRIGVVDPQAIIGSSDEWRDLAEATQEEFQTKVKDLQKQKEEFNKNRAKADRGNMKELAKEQKNIEIEEQSLQVEFQQKQQDLQMQMMKKVDQAIEAVAKSQGWDAIFPKFFYASAKADITLDAVAEMNKQYKKQKAAAKFKKAGTQSEKQSDKN